MSQTEDTKPWPPLKKALWDVVMKAEINGKYVAAFPFVEELYTAALSALPSQGGVKVKELEWVAGDGETADNLYFEAKSIAGTYWVIAGEWGHRETSIHGMFDNDAEAFAAAQAHYEARIRSAITLQGEPVGYVFTWPNGRTELRQSDKPKDFDDWAATVTLAHQPVTAGLEKAVDALPDIKQAPHQEMPETLKALLSDVPKMRGSAPNTSDNALSLASRLSEYRNNPHHIDPMSDRFKHLIDEVTLHLRKTHTYLPPASVLAALKSEGCR